MQTVAAGQFGVPISHTHTQTHTHSHTTHPGIHGRKLIDSTAAPFVDSILDGTRQE